MKIMLNKSIIHADNRKYYQLSLGYRGYVPVLPIRTDVRRYQRFVMLLFDSVDNFCVVYEDELNIIESGT
jgi:hypothetical protein